MKKKLFALMVTMLMSFSILGSNKAYATNADKLYSEAFTAVSECQKNKTQLSVNQAREKINLLFKTDAAWAIGEFSKQVDQIQHPILVNIVSNITKFDSIMKQSVINDTRNLIKDLPSENWKSSYSSALDGCQQKLLNNLTSSYAKLEKDKTQQNKEYCLELIRELKTSINADIVNFAKSYESKANAIIISNNEKLVYIGNAKTKKFHVDTCNSLPDEVNRVYFKTKEEAIEAGYVQCKLCNP